MDSYKDYFRGKKITVMGLGLLGRGLNDVKFLASCGAELIVTDLKTKDQLARSLKQLGRFKRIRFVLGEHRLEDFQRRDMILKAAGVPLDSPYIAEAERNGIPVEMDASLFARLAGIPIIGVTGSKGKSTVTHLIHHILKAARRRVWLGGNVRGLATLPLIAKVRKGDIALLELDSWQLQGFGGAGISPHIAVFTNFLEDHLNYYRGDMQAYFNDKAHIFRFQQEGDYLIASPQAAAVIKKSSVDRRGKLIVASGKDIPSYWHLKLAGGHNQVNGALAIAAARLVGVKEAMIKKALESFAGVKGRMEFVRELKGIRYYNDTTATIPDSAIAALRAFSGKKVILLGGGADKNLEYAKFVKSLRGRIKALILFKGAASDKIVTLLPKRTAFPVKVAASMKEAMAKVKLQAARGDVVVLSPGAASFGVFKNEFDRGDQFVRFVRRLR